MLAAILLYPITLLYRTGILAWSIYWRFKCPVKVPAAVVSVGGLTAGGSGKTSLTVFLAKRNISKGGNAAVIARGYKRVAGENVVISGDSDVRWQDCGDEPLVIARSVPGLKVYVSSDKTSAALTAARAGHEMIIIDDGLQHRKLNRDVDIVCLDGSDPFGGNMLLPSGRLREPITALRRADILVIVDPPVDMAEIVGKLPSNLPVFKAGKKITGLKPAAGVMDEPAGPDCLAFCGLGNPGSFRSSLAKSGYRPVEFMVFSDHHRYKEEDIERIVNAFQICKADFMATTLKDVVKLEKIWNYRYPLYYLDIEIEMENEEGFFRLTGL